MAGGAAARSPSCCAGWIAEHGSPLNVLDPAPLGRNAGELQRGRRGSASTCAIYFARKANKALAFVDEARRSASASTSPASASCAGARARRPGRRDIVMTAAVKPRALLELLRRARA